MRFSGTIGGLGPYNGYVHVATPEALEGILQTPNETEPKPLPRDTGFLDLVKANLMDNTFRLWLEQHNPGQQVDPDFHITDEDLMGYEAFPHLAQAVNRSHLEAMKRIADDIVYRRDVVAHHGLAETLAASFVDPVGLLMGAATGGIGMGIRALRVPSKVAKAGKALQSASNVHPMLDVAQRTAIGAAHFSAFSAAYTGYKEMGTEDIGEKMIHSAGVGTWMGAFCSGAPRLFSILMNRNGKQFKHSLRQLSDFVQTEQKMPERMGTEADIRVQQTMQEAAEQAKKANPSRLPKGSDVPPNAPPTWMGAEDAYVAKAMGLESLPMSPDIALADSTFKTSRSFVSNMVPLSFRRVNEAGETVAQAPAVEMLINSDCATTLEMARKTFYQYYQAFLGENPDMSAVYKLLQRNRAVQVFGGKEYKTFGKRVMHYIWTKDAVGESSASVKAAGDALIQDVHRLSEKAFNAGVYNERDRLALLEEREPGEAADRLSQNMTDAAKFRDKRSMGMMLRTQDPVYFPRIWDTEKIRNHPVDFQNMLADAYARCGSQRTRAQLLESARRTTDRMMHLIRTRQANGRRLRGNELGRNIDVPSAYLEAFLVDDPMAIFEHFAHELIPDTHLMERFGTLSIHDIIKPLSRERDEMRKRVEAIHPEKEGKSANKLTIDIDRQYERDAKNMQLLFDRVRGEPRYKRNRLFNIAIAFNTARSLGRLPLACLYDTYNITMHTGISSFMRSFFKLVKANEFFGDQQTADLFVRACDATEVGRMTDLGDDVIHAVTCKLEKGMQLLANGTVKLSGGPWLDEKVRFVAGYACEERILKACKKVADGEAIAKGEREFLRRNGISEKQEKAIGQAFQKHGKINAKKVYIANVEQWEDRHAADALKAAVWKKRNESVLTPTKGAIPGFMDAPLARLLLQFKRCLMAAYTKTTIPTLQAIDAGNTGAVLLPLVIGATVSYLREIADAYTANRTFDHAHAMENVFLQMDALSYATFFTDTVAKMQGIDSYSRMAANSTLTQLLGPSAGLFVDAYQAGAGLYKRTQGGSMTAQELRALERMLPANNLIWWSRWTSKLVETGDVQQPRRKQTDEPKRPGSAKWLALTPIAAAAWGRKGVHNPASVHPKTVVQKAVQAATDNPNVRPPKVMQKEP